MSSSEAIELRPLIKLWVEFCQEVRDTTMSLFLRICLSLNFIHGLEALVVHDYISVVN